MRKSRSRLLFAVTLCVLLLGCAREFAPRDYSEEDRAFRDALMEESDFESRLALARLHFEHNELDAADAILRVLVQEDPDEPQALAWYGASNCKLAGRAQPWLLGFRKLYLVHACLDQVREAAAQAPDDVTVQLVLINTGATVDMFGSLDSAQKSLDRLLKDGNVQGDFPPSARAHIFLAAAEVRRARGDAQTAQGYLERVLALNADQSTVALARDRLAEL